ANAGGEGEQAALAEVVEGEVVRGGLGARSARADLLPVQEPGPRRLGDVEELEEQPVEIGKPAAVVGVEADREQVAGVDALQVCGEAGDLQLAQEAGLIGGVQVEDEQRIGLLEGDDVAAIPVEA